MTEKFEIIPRPQIASEAYEMIRAGKEIEIPNTVVFGLLRYMEKREGKFIFQCKVNELNKGYTIIIPKP